LPLLLLCWWKLLAAWSLWRTLNGRNFDVWRSLYDFYDVTSSVELPVEREEQKDEEKFNTIRRYQCLEREFKFLRKNGAKRLHAAKFKMVQ
jgi:hypothetical protein